jgi:hypothetical protein
MEIGFRADDHARREGGGVAAMLGMQDQVAVHQLCRIGRGLPAGDHPQEVCGV